MSDVLFSLATLLMALITTVAFCYQWYWERKNFLPRIIFDVNVGDGFGIYIHATVINAGISPAKKVWFETNPNIKQKLEFEGAAKKTMWFENGISYLAPNHQELLFTIHRGQILDVCPDGKFELVVHYQAINGKDIKDEVSVIDLNPHAIR